MEEPAQDTSDRVERERRFHDDRFTDDSARAAAGRFYDLAAGANEKFQLVVHSPSAGSVVLEYGCGTGSTSGIQLVDRGCEVHGIDISAVAVTQANEAARDAGIDSSRLHYEVMDAEHLTFPDSTFDLVFGSGILHHLDLDAAMSEIARVLKPEGTAVFLEPMGHNPAINLYRRLTPKMRTPDEHPLVISDLLLLRRHFVVADTSYFVLTSFAAVPARWSRRYNSVIRMLSKLDASIFRYFPYLRRFGWIVTIELKRPIGARQSAMGT